MMFGKFFGQVGKTGKECSVRRCDNEPGQLRFLVETGRDKEHFTELSEEEQEMVLTWLNYNVYPAQKVLEGHTSYGMKHVLESRTNIYLTNNMFKEAMLRCGFFPAEADELNWHFYIRKSSPIFTMQADGKDGLPMLGAPMDYSGEGCWEYRGGSWECSKCGRAPSEDDCCPDIEDSPAFSYCPHCGAKMRERG